MSPWLPSALRVVVSPDQVTLLRVRRTLGWRGLHYTVDEARSVPCDSATGAQLWRAALVALETALPGFADGRTSATVILSNQFLRYTLVPWHAELSDAEEELSFTRHCFDRVYGKAAQQWEVRLSQEVSESPRLASALDAELLDGLRGVFGGAGIPLRSIQPHLMATFNACRSGLPQARAWFALLEPGNLCLGLLDHGRWLQVRSLRIGGAWHEELPLILEREAYLADQPNVPHEVYLWDAGGGEAPLPETGNWTFHALGHGLAPAAQARAG